MFFAEQTRKQIEYEESCFREQFTFGAEVLEVVKKNLPPGTLTSHFCVRDIPRNGHSYAILLYHYEGRHRTFVLEIDICVMRGTARALFGTEQYEMPLQNFDGFILRIREYLRQWKSLRESRTA